MAAFRVFSEVSDDDLILFCEETKTKNHWVLWFVDFARIFRKTICRLMLVFPRGSVATCFHAFYLVFKGNGGFLSFLRFFWLYFAKKRKRKILLWFVDFARIFKLNKWVSARRLKLNSGPHIIKWTTLV